MKNAVLLGAREAHPARSRLQWLYEVWLPVSVVLIVVCFESTDTFSAEATAEFFFGPIANMDWARINHDGRKTGHFLWYGVTGLAWLRAGLMNWFAPMRLRSVAAWRGYAVAMAILCTIATASLDELHQSFTPRRTGLVSDVWLDTSGAAVLIACVALTWMRRRAAPSSALA